MAADELGCERFERIYRSIGYHDLRSGRPKKVIEAPAWGVAVSWGKTERFMEWAKKKSQSTSFAVDVAELIGKPVIDLTKDGKPENGDPAGPSKVDSDDVYHTYGLKQRVGDVYVEETKKLEGWSEMMDYFNKDRNSEPSLPTPKKTSAKRCRKD